MLYLRICVKRILIPIIICLILNIPIRVKYKDGGTVKYCAIAYSVTHVHTLISDPDGYYEGTRIRFLFWKVYDDVQFVETSLTK